MFSRNLTHPCLHVTIADAVSFSFSTTHFFAPHASAPGAGFCNYPGETAFTAKESVQAVNPFYTRGLGMSAQGLAALVLLNAPGAAKQESYEF
jgi:hypothetical protein